MATKTWKIGEYAQGGVITIDIKGKVIQIIGKEWDSSKGYSRSSDQSGAKEFTRGTIISEDADSYNKLYEFLIDLTTHYYADKLLMWIKSKVSLKSEW